jgi:hypothetical protein
LTADSVQDFLALVAFSDLETHVAERERGVFACVGLNARAQSSVNASIPHAASRGTDNGTERDRTLFLRPAPFSCKSSRLGAFFIGFPTSTSMVCARAGAVAARAARSHARRRPGLDLAACRLRADFRDSSVLIG